jgi:hypothetical protein
MATKIAPCPTFDVAAEKTVQAWRDAGSPRVIRLEGVEGVGKTGLSKLLKERIGAERVAGDSFVSKFDEPPAYRDCMRQPELDIAIEKAVATGRVVILDAVCLDEVAPVSRWDRGFVVYIKRLSFNNQEPIWHDGFFLEGEPPTEEVPRSIHEYHNRVKPHETADLIVEPPDEGHTMRSTTYDRNMRFDPPGAELI